MTAGQSTDAGRFAWLERVRPRRSTLLWGAVLLNLELLVVMTYLLFSDTEFYHYRYVVYPWVWINVGLWAAIRTTPAPSPSRDRWLAGLIAVGYFGLLAYFGGLLSLGHAAHGHTHSLGFSMSVMTVPPGLGPLVGYQGALVSLTLIPYKIIGYLALAYLVFATVLDATGSAIGGLLGILSCVSCSWPILASIVTGVAGASSGVATVVYSQSFGLSTLVFIVTVGLLYWRPFGPLGRD